MTMSALPSISALPVASTSASREPSRSTSCTPATSRAPSRTRGGDNSMPTFAAALANLQSFYGFGAPNAPMLLPSATTSAAASPSASRSPSRVGRPGFLSRASSRAPATTTTSHAEVPASSATPVTREVAEQARGRAPVRKDYETAFAELQANGGMTGTRQLSPAEGARGAAF